eukprot:1178367-Rhodomonas_salina.1
MCFSGPARRCSLSVHVCVVCLRRGRGHGWSGLWECVWVCGLVYGSVCGWVVWSMGVCGCVVWSMGVCVGVCRAGGFDIGGLVHLLADALQLRQHHPQMLRLQRLAV